MKGLRCARAAETGKGNVLSVGARDVPLGHRVQWHRCGEETAAADVRQRGES